MENVVIEEYNNSSVEIDAKFVKNFSAPIIYDPKNYKVAITRLKIPTSSLPTLTIPDSEINDYYMRLDFPTSSAYVASKLATSGNVRMLNESDGLTYYSPHAVIEGINRSLQYIHEQVFEQFTASVETETHTINVSAAAFATYNHTVAIASAVKTAYIKFKVNSFTITNPNIPIRIMMTNTTTSKKILLYSGSALSGTSLNGKTNITFAESGYLDFDNYDSRISTYKPVDSFREVEADSPNATWSVRVEASENITATLNYTLEFCGVDASIHNITPYFSLNDGKYLTFNYMHYLPDRNPQFIFSHKLAKMFWFPDNLHRISNQEFRFVFPSRIITHTALSTMQTITQSFSSFYMLTNLDKINVQSSSLNTSGEINLREENNNLLSDFIVNTAEPLEYLEYSVDFNPFRKYKLENTAEVRRIDIEIYANYANGQKKIIRYCPGESVFIRLTFFSSKDQTYI